jgi:hypothetical protein
MLALVLNAVSTVLSEQHRSRLMLCLGSLLAVLFITRRLRQWQRLRHIPGPSLAGFSRMFWLVPMARSGEIPAWMLDIERRYGKNMIIKAHAWGFPARITFNKNP